MASFPQHPQGEIEGEGDAQGGRGGEQGRQRPKDQVGLVVGHGGDQGQAEAGHQQHRGQPAEPGLGLAGGADLAAKALGNPQPLAESGPSPQDIGVLGDQVGLGHGGGHPAGLKFGRPVTVAPQQMKGQHQGAGGEEGDGALPQGGKDHGDTVHQGEQGGKQGQGVPVGGPGWSAGPGPP